MHSSDMRNREILGLRTRAITAVVDNYSKIFHSREDYLDHIPKPIRKEIFARLVNKGILENPLLTRIIDKNTDLLDLKSVRGVNDSNCLIIKSFTNLRVMYLSEVLASSNALSQMFSGMHRLTTLELTNSPTFNDTVLKTLAENCPCLKILGASRTGISDEGITILGENSLCLIAMDISHTNVSFLGMEKLISSPTGQTLKELKCRGSKICGRQEILSTILGFKLLEDYSFTFHTNDDADWVLSRVTIRLKNFAFNIPI